jgi:hypothetical protein
MATSIVPPDVFMLLGDELTSDERIDAVAERDRANRELAWDECAKYERASYHLAGVNPYRKQAEATVENAALGRDEREAHELLCAACKLLAHLGLAPCQWPVGLPVWWAAQRGAGKAQEEGT